MKTYYLVRTSYHDCGLVVAGCLDVKQLDSKPKKVHKKVSRRDVYFEWFDSEEEARQAIDAARSQSTWTGNYYSKLPQYAKQG